MKAIIKTQGFKELVKILVFIGVTIFLFSFIESL